MIARLVCGALQGIEAYKVELEIDYTKAGMPAFVMVGLAEGAVKEAKERVFTAIRACAFKLAPAKITVNLAPADRKKAGTAYDLPLAIGLLTASQNIHPSLNGKNFFCRRTFIEWDTAACKRNFASRPFSPLFAYGCDDCCA